MSPPAGGEGESEGRPDTPLPQLEPQPEPEPEPIFDPDEEPPGPDEEEPLGPIAIYVMYRCPLFWCPLVICQWTGANYEIYNHCVVDAEEYHGDGVIELKEIDAPTLCEWSNYVQTCDIGGEENGFYRLLMKTHGNMAFFLSAKANNDGNTGMHVFYIGEAERAERYSCKVDIENRGEEAAAPIHLALACGQTDGMTVDMVTISQQVGVTLQNEVLKSCCPENGSLYFWVELQIPEGEHEDENPVLVEISDEEEEL